MKQLRSWMLGLLMATGIMGAQAQIGYQICLLNTATGEPRANETVNVTVKLTNNEGDIIYTGEQSATTNDFGVLSLTIGNKDTFKDVDLSKLPFWIEVSANGVMIGKSQVLSVPVAEVAKRVAPALTKEELCSKTWYLWDEEWSKCYFNFSNNGAVKLTYYNGHNSESGTYTGTYEMEGPNLWLLMDDSYVWEPNTILVRYMKGKLYVITEIF